MHILLMLWLTSRVTANVTFASTDSTHPQYFSSAYDASTSDSAAKHSPRSTECSACGHREALKIASLESIKQHVLLKLGFHQTTPTLSGNSHAHFPAVPAQLLQNFYQQNGGVQTARNAGSLVDAPMQDRMFGDQPQGRAREGGREVIEEEDDDYFPTPSTIYALTHRKYCHFQTKEIAIARLMT